MPLRLGLLKAISFLDTPCTVYTKKSSRLCGWLIARRKEVWWEPYDPKIVNCDMREQQADKDQLRKAAHWKPTRVSLRHEVAAFMLVFVFIGILGRHAPRSVSMKNKCTCSSRWKLVIASKLPQSSIDNKTSMNLVLISSQTPTSLHLISYVQNRAGFLFCHSDFNAFRGPWWLTEFCQFFSLSFYCIK